MKRIGFVLGLLGLLGLLTEAQAQSIALLPNAETQFSDANGAPFTGGKVYFYVPGTTTPKATWQDSGGTTLNTNPVILDSAGRAIIWGNGSYREILQDQFGNTIWDQITSAGASAGGLPLIWYGQAQGTGNAIVLASPSGLTTSPFTGIDGQQVGWRVLTSNSGATTLNVSSFGSIPLYKPSTSGPVALGGGELDAGGGSGNVVYATYIASLNAFVATSGLVGVSQVPSGAISPVSFGAKCDGSNDDTSAFQATVNSLQAKGGLIQVQAATCVIAGTLTVQYNGITIEGAGENATVLLFTGSGTADGIEVGSSVASGVCIGGTPPPACYQTSGDGLRNISLQAPNRLGGFLLDVNGTLNFSASNVTYSGWKVLRVIYSNTATFSNFNGYTRVDTEYAIDMTMSITTGTTAGWYNDIAPTFYNFIVNAQGLNTVGGCLNIDGPIFTPILYSVHLLNCGNGMAISNSARSTTIYPEFVQSYDLEIDGASIQGLIVQAGSQGNFIGCDVDVSAATSGSHYPLLMGNDYGFSYTRGYTFTGCQFHDGPSSAAFIEGIAITFANDQFYDTNKGVTGTLPAVVISAANTDNILISGSLAGQRYGDSAQPNYGVLIDSSVTGTVSLTGNDYTAATTGSVNNATANTQGLTGGIGFGHSPISSVNCAATTVCN